MLVVSPLASKRRVAERTVVLGVAQLRATTSSRNVCGVAGGWSAVGHEHRVDGLEQDVHRVVAVRRCTARSSVVVRRRRGSSTAACVLRVERRRARELGDVRGAGGVAALAVGVLGAEFASVMNLVSWQPSPPRSGTVQAGGAHVAPHQTAAVAGRAAEEDDLRALALREAASGSRTSSSCRAGSRSPTIVPPSVVV